MIEAAKIPEIDNSEPWRNDKQPRVETFLDPANIETGNHS